MRKKTLKEDIRGSFSMSAGWLFADLLLVLAMLFLAANTMGIHPPPPLPTPTPVTPTPNILPQLEQSYHRFPIRVDTTALLAGDRNAANSVMHQIQSQGFLQGRSVGLIIAYGGAPSVAQIGRAESVATKVYGLVQRLGGQDATFSNTRHYDPLYILGGNANTISIDIFLFAQHSPT